MIFHHFDNSFRIEKIIKQMMKTGFFIQDDNGQKDIMSKESETEKASFFYRIEFQARGLFC